MKGLDSFSGKMWLFFKGVIMGAVNKVPGISGGVVAFVMGFYEEFIYSLQKINLKAFKLLFNGRFKSFYNYINGKFLFLLIAGMVFSYFSVSLLLDFLIRKYELFVWSVFFGLIIGSIFYIAQDFKEWNRRNIIIVFMGVIAGISLSFLEPAAENDNLIFVFLCGIISVSGMTLPGLSGSFILMLLGNYVLLLVDSVNALFVTITDMAVLDFSFVNDSQRLRLLQVLASFTLGSLVGLVSLSHVLGYLLKHYKSATYAGIMGFIAGTLGVVWPWKEKVYKLDFSGNIIVDDAGNEVINNYVRYAPDFTSKETLLAVLFIVLGVVFVLAMAWSERRNKLKAHQS
ncbi:MAG TPA: DUF368 domain-containing protein [Flavobacteriaceae bacterium]|nr:DUF368 domain-containing protein [Flavobacteriaceae bacterium]